MLPINILFYTFEFDLKNSSLSGLSARLLRQKHGNKINEPDINKIATNDALGVWERERYTPFREPLHSENRTNKTRMKWREIEDICVKLLTTVNPPFLARNLLPLCSERHIKRVRVIKCKGDPGYKEKAYLRRGKAKRRKSKIYLLLLW